MERTIKLYIDKLVELAQHYPDKPLIVDRDGTRVTTRKVFLDKSRQIAGYLNSLNLPENALLPIALNSCMEYLAIDFGSWMAGHGTVHLSDSYPKARIKFIASDCKAPFVFDQNKVEEALRHKAIDTLAKRTEDNYAIAFYTSGSTGNPKGIIHTDSFFCSVNQNLLLSRNDSFIEEDSYAPTTPLNFTAMQYIYGAIWSGATVHLISDEIKHDMRNMENYLSEHRITVSFMPPSMLREFKNKDRSLKKVITAGEKLVNIAPPKDYIIQHTYGMTEAPYNALSYTIDQFYERAPLKPVGRTEVKLVDNIGKSVPQGVIGEMLIKLPILPIFINNDEKNSMLKKEGWLHTQDLMIQNEKDEYIFVNRKDWMIKINGQRIEPGEIETVMKRIDGIMDCVVKGFSTPSGSRQYLAAFYRSHKEFPYDSLVEELSKNLPDYMIPKVLIHMESFPHNANGKVDRKALTPPDTSVLQKKYEAPTNIIEETLCNAFAQIIGIRIGINDDFFRFGGNSIQMMSLQQICADSGIECLRFLSSKMIYQGRTPRGIAAILAESKINKEILVDYPLNGIQNSYYQICAQHAGIPLFNISNLLKLDASVNMERLASAIESVVDIHSGFHTRFFRALSGEVRQKIVKETFKLQIEHLSKETFEDVKKRLIKPFFLLSDRLFRFRLFETDTDKFFFYDIHHIIFDGASQIILFRDIERAYRKLPLEHECWNLQEMSAEEFQVRKTPALSKAKKWYLKTFGDASPILRPDTDSRTSNTLTKIVIKLDVDAMDVKNFCDSIGITFNAITTASFALMLGEYANTQDVVFASAYNAREDIRVRNTIGLFARPLFIRSRWNSHTLTRNFLKEMRDNLLACMDNSIYSYADMQRDIPFSPGYLFIYQGKLTEEPVLGGYPTKKIIIAEKQAISAIEFHLFLNQDETSFELEMLYKQAFYSDKYIRQMGTHFQTVLKGMMTSVQLNEARCFVTESDKFSKIFFSKAYYGKK